MTIHLTTVLLDGAGTTSAAVAMGLASAASFATSNALQHRAAGTVPPAVHRVLAVLGHLARQRVWVVATCISFCALVLHALALRIGSIALVQPLMLVGVVLAVPVRSALEHKTPRWCEIRAVGVTAVGLTVFILSMNTQSPGAPPAIPVAGAFVLGCSVVGLFALRTSRSHRSAGAPARQAAILGAGAGVMFGATAGLLKVVGTSVPTHWSALPTTLVVLGMLVAAGLLGTAMNQRAYQLAPISYSMPMVNVVDIMVAVLFGAVVFGELPAHTPAMLALQLSALGCVSVGLRLIAALDTEGVDLAPESTAAGELR